MVSLNKQEHHQHSRYGDRDSNNHIGQVVGRSNGESVSSIYKHQDYINDKPNVIPKRMNNTEKLKEVRKINQRKKEGSRLVVDNSFN